MNFARITTIEKENIPWLEFHNHEVLMLDSQIKYRQYLLHRAMLLGNNDHTKVKMIFECDQGLYKVETTVWATTDDYVLLKGGVYLPIKSILDVVIL